MSKKNKKQGVKCWRCGKDTGLTRSQSNMTLRQFCEKCWEEYKAEKAETTKIYARQKILMMHERALRLLEKQEVNMYDYQEEAEVVLSLALNSETQKFKSAPEMVAAMEFLRNLIKIKVQWPVGAYRVDFLVESLKTVVEIDGMYHDNKKVKDNMRDIEIRRVLGKEWEIIRIPSKYIEENVQMLIPAIAEIKKYKQKLRAENNGIIPETYSAREKEHYGKLLKGKTKRVSTPKGMGLTL